MKKILISSIIAGSATALAFVLNDNLQKKKLKKQLSSLNIDDLS